jgi:hypothetical protein
MENDSKVQKRGRKPKNGKTEDQVTIENIQKTEEQKEEQKSEDLIDEIPYPSTEEIEAFIEKINKEIEQPIEGMKVVVEDIMEEVKTIVSTMEEKKEDIINVIEEKTEQFVEQVVNKSLEIKSLLNLLIIISVRSDMQEKYCLTPELVKILQSIIQNNSSFFFKIEESFKKIVEDSKIDSQDVPELMSLFSNVYELIFSLNINLRITNLSNICGELIKLTFNIMIEEGLIIFDFSSKELARTTFNALVDSSVSLIKLSNTVKFNNKCCVIW